MWTSRKVINTQLLVLIKLTQSCFQNLWIPYNMSVGEHLLDPNHSDEVSLLSSIIIIL